MSGAPSLDELIVENPEDEYFVPPLRPGVSRDSPPRNRAHLPPLLAVPWTRVGDPEPRRLPTAHDAGTITLLRSSATLARSTSSPTLTIGAQRSAERIAEREDLPMLLPRGPSIPKVGSIGVPDEESYGGMFEQSPFGLEPAPRVESYRGFIFVNFDPMRSTRRIPRWRREGTSTTSSTRRRLLRR